jgi:hypothetical protein
VSLKFWTKGTIAFAVGWFIFIFVIVLLMGAASHRSDFMEDCLANGHKKFECEVMYQQTQPQHVIITR